MTPEANRAAQKRFRDNLGPVAYKEWRQPSVQRAVAKLRNEVFEAYGNSCACCDETITKFLTIDHINNDGCKDKKPNGERYKGPSLWRKLRRAGFPSGYQVLCWNCNCGRALNGGVCPHTEGSA